MLYKSYIHVKFKLFSVNAVYFTYQLLPGNKCFVSRGALATKADILIVLFFYFILSGIIFSFSCRVPCLKFSSRRAWRLFQQKARCGDSGAASFLQGYISFFLTAAGMYLSLLGGILPAVGIPC